jgi:hypothetical protein
MVVDGQELIPSLTRLMSSAKKKRPPSVNTTPTLRIRPAPDIGHQLLLLRLRSTAQQEDRSRQRRANWRDGQPSRDAVLSLSGEPNTAGALRANAHLCRAESACASQGRRSWSRRPTERPEPASSRRSDARRTQSRRRAVLRSSYPESSAVGGSWS